MGSWLSRLLRPPVLPPDAKIITFPGMPKPEDAALGRWNAKSEIRTPAEHLKWVWQHLIHRRPWRRQISRYIQKADWVAQNWRE